MYSSDDSKYFQSKWLKKKYFFIYYLFIFTSEIWLHESLAEVKTLGLI